MKAMRAIAMFFAVLIMTIGLTIAYTSFFTGKCINDLDRLPNIAELEMQLFFTENSAALKELMLGEMKSKGVSTQITKQELEAACNIKPENMPEGICANLANVPEQGASDYIMDKVISDYIKEIRPAIDAELNKAKATLQQNQASKMVIAGIIAGLFVYLIGCLIVLIANAFALKKSLLKIMIPTFFVSAFQALGLFAMLKISPEQLMPYVKNISVPEVSKELSDMIVRVFVKITLQWLAFPIRESIPVALIASAVSLALVVALIIIRKRDMPPETLFMPDVKSEKKKEDKGKKEEKKLEKASKAEKKGEKEKKPENKEEEQEENGEEKKQGKEQEEENVEEEKAEQEEEKEEEEEKEKKGKQEEKKVSKKKKG